MPSRWRCNYRFHLVFIWQIVFDQFVSPLPV